MKQMWPLCGQNDAPPTFTRVILRAWVQPVFLHLWQVYIRIKDDEWNVYRRYTEFRGLHHQLQSAFPQVRAYSFPPKKAIGNKVCIQGPVHCCLFCLPLKTAHHWKTAVLGEMEKGATHEPLPQGRALFLWVGFPLFCQYNFL